MSGVEIDEKHHVSRYCKPLFIDDGLPSAEAFVLRDNEEYLSVNWLEYFNTPNLTQAIDCVRQVFRDKGYSVGIKGKFVSLKVRELKDVIPNHTDLDSRTDTLNARFTKKSRFQEKIFTHLHAHLRGRRNQTNPYLTECNGGFVNSKKRTLEVSMQTLIISGICGIGLRGMGSYII